MRIIKKDEYSKVFETYKKSKALIWCYSPSLRRVGVLLEKSNQKDFLVLMIAGAKHINGKFNWENAFIEYSKGGEGEVDTIQDTSNNFKLSFNGGIVLALTENLDIFPDFPPPDRFNF